MESENSKIKEVLGFKVVLAGNSLSCPSHWSYLSCEVSVGCLLGTPGVPPVAF